MTSHTEISVSRQLDPEIGQSLRSVSRCDTSINADQMNLFGMSVEDLSQTQQTYCVPYDQSELEKKKNEKEKSEKQKSEKKTSRRAPCIMLFSFLSASVLAVVHDIMNRSLNGSIVDPNGPWNQQWTSRYATALAFLIRMLFVTSVGTAFVQKQWLDLSTRAISVQNVDVLSNALSSPFSLLSKSAWMKSPLLMMMAVISWILPFAAVVTPGTLSVETLPYTYDADFPVLQIAYPADLDSGWYAGDGNPDQGDGNLDQYTDPGDDGEDSEGYNPELGPVYYGPGIPQLSRLAFAAVVSAQIVPMKSDFANQTYVANFVGPALRCADANATITSSATDFARENLLEYLSWIGDIMPWTQVGNLTEQNYMFNTTIPDVYDEDLEGDTESNNTLWVVSLGGPEYNVKECQLWNATYDAEFTFENFEQTTTLHALTYEGPILSISSADPDEIEGNLQNDLPKAILSAFGSLMVGMQLKEDSGLSHTSNFELLNVNFTNPEKLNKGLEEVFVNITLSLLSERRFLDNGTTNSSTTTISGWSNKYVYQEKDLIVAYGMAFGASLICCVLGMLSYGMNGNSFQNNFSTYIRAAEGSNFRASVSPGDTGAGPLPRRIGEKTVRLASRPRMKYRRRKCVVVKV